MKFRFWITIIVFTILFSCSEKSGEDVWKVTKKSPKLSGMVAESGSLKAPVILKAGKPEMCEFSMVNNDVSHVRKEGLGHFTNYTTEDGLALDGVTCSMCDHFGNIWFGTPGGGISRFDGKKFTNFNTQNGLSGNNIRNLVEDHQGNIWILTYGKGLSIYDGRSIRSFGKKEGLVNNEVFCVFEDSKKRIWLGTKQGVFIYDGKKINRQNLNHQFDNIDVTTIIEDDKQKIWFGTNGHGMFSFDGQVFKQYKLAKSYSGNVVWSMAKDQNGSLWIGSKDGTISCFKGSRIRNFSKDHNLSNHGVRCITVDQKGIVWLGTDLEGLIGFDGNYLSHYTTSSGLLTNDIRSITLDDVGNLWVGNYGGGVSCFNGKGFVNYTAKQGLASQSIHCIAEDKDGNLWYGTHGGRILHFNGQKFTNYQVNGGKLFPTVTCYLIDSKGNHWLGSIEDGVGLFDGKTFVRYTVDQGLSSNFVKTIVEDKKGNIWFGTRGGGVSCFDGKRFVNYTTRQGLVNNAVNCSFTDQKGNVWFGTMKGLSCFDGDRFTNYTTVNGLKNNIIWCINQDRFGVLWLGTDGGGLTRLYKGDFIHYSTFDGLPDNIVTQIVISNDRTSLVFGTNFGVGVLRSFSSDNNGKRKVEIHAQNALDNKCLTKYSPDIDIYNPYTNFPLKDVNAGQNSLFQTSKGEYWAGTGSNITALVRFDLRELNKNVKPLRVVLQKIKVNDQDISYYSFKNDYSPTIRKQQEILAYNKELSIADRQSVVNPFSKLDFDSISAFYPIPSKLRLPFDHNAITFEFKAIAPSYSDLVHYEYMLAGYDRKWKSTSINTTATYNNLFEGTYRFIIKAKYTGPNGNKSWGRQTMYTFKVLPPWYRSWWMYIIYLTSTIGALYMYIRWRTSELKKRQKVLEKIVKERTEEVSHQKALIEEKHQEIKDSINYAERIQRALLTSKKILNDNLKDYFILYRPKDVVSGDFYWASKLQNGNFAMLLGDSTGHGVPGAIMTMLNISCLEKVVAKGITSPDEILFETRKLIVEYLKNDGTEEGGRDGMDCSLICFDFENNIMSTSAAYNPIWVIRQGEIIEIQADRMPVGKHEKDQEFFTLHTLPLQKDDLIILFTDGYVDQFGGADKKKFKQSRFKELLLKVANEPLDEQQKIIDLTFQDWKKNLEQIDDMCVIGILI